MSNPLSAEIWLIARRRRDDWQPLTVRLAKRKPNVDAGEVAVRVNLEIPRAYFARPSVTATVAAHDENRAAIVTAAVANEIAEIIKGKTGLDVTLTIAGAGVA